jgi:hypothetical protein
MSLQLQPTFFETAAFVKIRKIRVQKVSLAAPKK